MSANSEIKLDDGSKLGLLAKKVKGHQGMIIGSLIVFSESATSIVPLDSVTVALEDELNKVEAVSQSIPISNPQSIVQ